MQLPQRLLVCLGLAFAVGCGSDTDDAGRRGSGPAGGQGNIGGAAGSPGNAGDGIGPSGGSPNDCGGETFEGEVKGQLDIFIVFDMSTSMFLGAPTIFEATSDAIKGFVADPQAAGVGIGVRGYGDECSVAALSIPDVPVDKLPNNAQAITTWLDQQWAAFMPVGPIPGTFTGTNTYPAMQGAIEFQTQWALDHPDSKAVILLVTDGKPDNECGSDDIPGIAAEGLARGIPTYVLGLGNIDGLNEVAAAGGTGQAFIADATSAAAITDQLNAIRGDAQPLPCEFVIPPGGGDTPDLVNLDFTPLGAAAATTVPRVDSAAACDPAIGGWYYDDPSSPNTMITCDSTCGTLSAGGGRVDIALGCPTVVLE